jgi:hypothetical protein
MGIYFFWPVMTILSTRVYLNLVFLAREPTLDLTTDVSRAQFASPSPWGKVRIRRTTTREGEIVTFGEKGTRAVRPETTFDTVRECFFLCPHVRW